MAPLLQVCTGFVTTHCMLAAAECVIAARVLHSETATSTVFETVFKIV